MKISSQSGSHNCVPRKAYRHGICRCRWGRQNYINNIENKKSLPAMQSFFYICEYLGVTPKEFFDDENTDPTALREFIQEAQRLDAKSMEYILGIMKELNSRK